MHYNKITFKNSTSAMAYKRYMQMALEQMSNLSNDQQEDILCEINSHIFEALQYRHPSQTIHETNPVQLQSILDALGSPTMFIGEMAAMMPSKPMIKSPSTWQRVAKAPLVFTRTIINLCYYSVYTLIAITAFLIVAKVIDPNGVGFFYHPNKFFVFGKLILEHGEAIKYEQLGNYFIPFLIALVTILYYSSTLILKLKKLIDHKL